MCNYRHDGKTCQFINIPYINDNLDNSGLCVMHSHDYDWKVKQQFHTVFKKLLGYYLDPKYTGIADFDGCVFIAKPKEHNKSRFNEPFIEARNLIFNVDVTFINAYFYGWGAFDNSEFKKTVRFDQTKFGSTTFKGSFFNRAHFNALQFEGYADFEDASFKGHVYFNEIEFKKRAYFQGVTFGNHAEFKHMVLHERVNFTDIAVNHKWGIQFIDVELSQPQAELIYQGQKHARLFDNISANGLVNITFQYIIEGASVQFQYVNITKIKHYDQLINLSQNGAINIGEQCGSTHKITIKKINNSFFAKAKIHHCIIEALNNFLKNQYDKDFSVAITESKNNYNIEFSSKSFVSTDEWFSMRDKFSRTFEKRLVSVMSKDDILKEHIKKLAPCPSHIEAADPELKSLASIDLEMDCMKIAERVKYIDNLSITKKILSIFNKNKSLINNITTIITNCSDE